jgi:hypothetical protein
MHDSHPIVACARSWIGTRFHHQGRLKKADGHKGGVDVPLNEYDERYEVDIVLDGAVGRYCR